MDYKVTFEDGSSAYLTHYGVKGMKWRKHLKKGIIEDGKETFDKVVGALTTVGETIEAGRQKLDSTFDNPLYLAKQRVEKAESSGENAAARRRLKSRYSKKGVKASGGKSSKKRYEIRL